MQYMKLIDDGSIIFPYDSLQILRDNPNTSFPMPMKKAMKERHGVFSVTDKIPSYNKNKEKLGKKTTVPQLLGKKWVLTWEVLKLTDDELKKDLTNEASTFAPVIAAGVTVTGGIDSAIKIKNIYDMAIANNETEVFIFDADNKLKSISIDDASTIYNAVYLAYTEQMIDLHEELSKI